MARVVRFHQTGGPEVLQVEDIAVPPPAEGEVQISIKALGLNRAESMFRRGQYLENPKLPARLGYEAAGPVAAIGLWHPAPGWSASESGRLRQEAAGPPEAPQRASVAYALGQYREGQPMFAASRSADGERYSARSWRSSYWPRLIDVRVTLQIGNRRWMTGVSAMGHKPT